MRFSTVTFGREFPDSDRNPRRFAIKHYTQDGNYDVVGLNWVSDAFLQYSGTVPSLVNFCDYNRYFPVVTPSKDLMYT